MEPTLAMSPGGAAPPGLTPDRYEALRRYLAGDRSPEVIQAIAGSAPHVFGYNSPVNEEVAQPHPEQDWLHKNLGLLMTGGTALFAPEAAAAMAGASALTGAMREPQQPDESVLDRIMRAVQQGDSPGQLAGEKLREHGTAPGLAMITSLGLDAMLPGLHGGGAAEEEIARASKLATEPESSALRGGLGVPTTDMAPPGRRPMIADASRDIVLQGLRDGRDENQIVDQLMALPNAPKLALARPHLRGMAQAIDEGLPFANWYEEMGDYFLGLMSPDSFHEFAHALANTTQRASPVSNVSAALRSMVVAREMLQRGTFLGPRARSEFINVVLHDYPQSDKSLTVIASGVGRVYDELVDSMNGITRSLGPKQASFATDFEAAHQREYILGSTIDTWMARLARTMQQKGKNILTDDELLTSAERTRLSPKKQQQLIAKRRESIIHLLGRKAAADQGMLSDALSRTEQSAADQLLLRFQNTGARYTAPHPKAGQLKRAGLDAKSALLKGSGVGVLAEDVTDTPQYEWLNGIVDALAASRGIPPRQAQAAMWFVVKTASEGSPEKELVLLRHLLGDNNALIPAFIEKLQGETGRLQAAVRGRNGQVFTGEHHGVAGDKAFNAGVSDFEDGFLDQHTGEFLTRDEANRGHGISISEELPDAQPRLPGSPQETIGGVGKRLARDVRQQAREEVPFKFGPPSHEGKVYASQQSAERNMGELGSKFVEGVGSPISLESRRAASEFVGERAPRIDIEQPFHTTFAGGLTEDNKIDVLQRHGIPHEIVSQNVLLVGDNGVRPAIQLVVPGGNYAQARRAAALVMKANGGDRAGIQYLLSSAATERGLALPVTPEQGKQLAQLMAAQRFVGQVDLDKGWAYLTMPKNSNPSGFEQNVRELARAAGVDDSVLQQWKARDYVHATYSELEEEGFARQAGERFPPGTPFPTARAGPAAVPPIHTPVEPAALKRFEQAPPAGKLDVSHAEAQRIYDSVKANGGISYDVVGHSDLGGKPLIAVSVYPDRSKIIPAAEITKESVAQHILDFAEKNKDLLARPHHVVGGWIDGDGSLYLDVTAVLPSSARADAVKLGKAFNQKAIFDLEKFEEIATGGTGEALKKMPSVAKRVQLIAKAAGGGGGK